MERFRFYAFKLAGICIGVFLLQLLIPSFTGLFVLNQSAWPEIWRFISAIFLHADIGHLAYNLFALVLFGSIVEKVIESKKFLIIFFVSGIVANLVSINFYSSSLGASGAIFGIIGALIVLRPGMTVWAFSMPMPMALAGILWAAGDLIGAYGFLVGNPVSNTGNIAHLSGMFFGFIFGMFYRKKRDGRNNSKIIVNEESIRSWENRYMGF